jgi:hypothetical protein
VQAAASSTALSLLLSRRTIFLQKLLQRGCWSGSNDWSLQRHFRGLG